MEKNWQETELIFNIKEEYLKYAHIYASGTDLQSVPHEILSTVLKSILRGVVRYTHFCFSADNVAYHLVDDKNNFITAIVVSKVKDDEGKSSYSLKFILNEEEYDKEKSSFEKIVECNEPSLTKFLSEFLTWFSTTNDNTIRLQESNSGIMYLLLLAMMQGIKSYANNLTASDLTEELVIKLEDDLIISVKLEDDNKVIDVEAGTALKTYAKDDVGIQE